MHGVLDIAHGGSVRCAVPRTAEDRSTMFAAAIGASLLLGCKLVLARHWLPGIHLFVQAVDDLPANAPIPHLCTEWLRLQPDVVAWLDQADDSDHLAVCLPTTLGSCHLARDHASLRFDEVAFTFDLQWRLPPALRA